MCPHTLTLDRPPVLAGVVGDSACLRRVVGQVRAYAAMPWPALIIGETGSGKEAVARALHALSPRSALPLVAVNCAAIPDELAESMFFGHERGAFTGAAGRREGLLEQVAGGTLFLDEIGELSCRIQAKLLRVLQEGTYQRVGGADLLRFSGRVVAATHRPLDDSARSGFRADLYHRLSTFVIRVPALRERADDIPALARYLLQRAFAELPGFEPLPLAEDALNVLAAQPWPGNVRELENVIRGGLALAIAERADAVRVEHLGLAETSCVAVPDAPPAPAPASTGLLAATDAFQRDLVHRVIAANTGNKTRAARDLGVSRQWLHALLARWDGPVAPPRQVERPRRASAA
jgi:transcriptional regulator with GAF, ATPase, and Fis domain